MELLAPLGKLNLLIITSLLDVRNSTEVAFTLPTLLFESSMTAGKLKAPFSESLTLKN